MVDIEMFGLPADSVRKGVHKTRYQPGPHPKWESPNEEFLFEKVNEPISSTCIHDVAFHKVFIMLPTKSLTVSIVLHYGRA